MEEESFRPKVVCIPPDDEMGFLLNLPPPCNVILQPSTIGLSGKVPESPFMQAYQKFLRGETPIKPAAPVEPPPPDALPGKKKYIPPYTPNQINRPRTSSVPQSRPSASSSSNNRPKPVINRPVQQPRPQASSVSSSVSSSASMQMQQKSNKKVKHHGLSEDEALEVESKFVYIFVLICFVRNLNVIPSYRDRFFKNL